MRRRYNMEEFGRVYLRSAVRALETFCELEIHERGLVRWRFVVRVEYTKEKEGKGRLVCVWMLACFYWCGGCFFFELMWNGEGHGSGSVRYCLQRTSGLKELRLVWILYRYELEKCLDGWFVESWFFKKSSGLFYWKDAIQYETVCEIKIEYTQYLYTNII